MSEERAADQAAAEEAVATALFGPEETPEDDIEEYQPDPKPIEEGEESEESEEEATDDDPKDEPDGPEEVEVELDGEVFIAPKKVAEALMRNKDYTEKTQAVAAQRKETEVLQGEVKLRSQQFEFAQQIQPDILKAQQLEADEQQAREYLRNNVDTLSAADVTKLQLAIQERREERDNLVQSLQGKQTEFQQAQEQAHRELLDKGTEVLRQKVPGWGEEQTKQVRSYAIESGFTDAELNGVTDPRQVLALWKASQYDKLKSGVAPAVTKVQSAPKIKSRNPMPKETQDKLNLRKKIKNPNTSKQEKADLVGMDLAKKFGM